MIFHAYDVIDAAVMVFAPLATRSTPSLKKSEARACIEPRHTSTRPKHISVVIGRVL
jgi:hypothetical protein